MYAYGCVCVCVCVFWHVSVLLATWCYRSRVGNTPGVIMKDDAEPRKPILTFPLPLPVLSKHVWGNFKQIRSGLMDSVGRLALQWVMRGHSDLTLCGDFAFFVGVCLAGFPLHSSTITPKTLVPPTYEHQTCAHTLCNNSHTPCSALPWEQEQWLPADINKKPTAHIRFIIGQATFAKSTMLVSGQRVFFPCLATI